MCQDSRIGSGLARVPNLRVCTHLCTEVAHAGGGERKGEVTSCRGTVSRRGQQLQVDARKEGLPEEQVSGHHVVQG